MKSSIQAVERLMNCILERFDSIGALDPLPQGQSLGPLGIPKAPLGHKIHIFEDRKLKFGIQAVKDGPGPVRVSDTLCPAVHILGT